MWLSASLEPQARTFYFKAPLSSKIHYFMCMAVQISYLPRLRLRNFLANAHTANAHIVQGTV